MRIPWYYCLLASLVAIALPLYLGMRNANPIPTPPAQHKPIQKKDHQPEKPTQNNNNNSNKTPPVPDKKKPKKIVVKAPTPAFLQLDVNTSPALNHFADQSLDSKTLQDYAAFLIETRHPVLASLALERLIDTAPDATVEDVRRAANARQHLGIPLWSPDPSSRKLITIQLRLSAAMRPKADAFRARLREHVLNASSGIVQAKIEISTSPKRANLPTLNFFSIRTAHGKQTPKIIFPDTPELTDKLLAALYNTIRNATVKQHQLRPPLKLDETKLDPAQAIYSHITRLTWKQFADQQ